METKKCKLHLRKEVVARLNTTEMNRLQGGVDYDTNKICPTEKADGCYVESDICQSALCPPATYPLTDCNCTRSLNNPCNSRTCEPSPISDVCHIESGYDLRDTCTCPKLTEKYCGLPTMVCNL